MPAVDPTRQNVARARRTRNRIGYRFMVLARRWRQAVDAELESYGLSHAAWRPLLKLACFESPPRQHELADVLQIGHPELVRLIDQLEQKGFVTRQDASDDRRVKRVALTAAGRKLADQIDDIITGFERRVLRGIPPDDVARVRDVIARVEQRLVELQVPPPVGRAATRSVAQLQIESPTPKKSRKP